MAEDETSSSSESDEPLPSSTEEPSAASAPPPDAKAKPAAPQLKFSTFVLTFMFLLGVVMIFDPSTRNTVAGDLNYLLYPAIGFGGKYVLLTMLVAGAVEMAITAAAYAYTTDWVKAAKLQKWSSALRPIQMKAFRSGKKDQLEAIKPHQAQLTKLSADVQIAQLKGMAITWFLIISIYSWVAYFLSSTIDHVSPMVNLGGSSVNLLAPVVLSFPLWFLLFSVYTVPFNLLFRRVFKHYQLRRIERNLTFSPAATSAAGGDA